MFVKPNGSIIYVSFLKLIIEWDLIHQRGMLFVKLTTTTKLNQTNFLKVIFRCCF